MITAETIRLLIEKDLIERGFFLVDVQVKSSKRILVYTDNFSGITLDECASISRFIEDKVNPIADDYELEVSSPGLDNPLKLPVQYQKNIGKLLRIIKTDGETKEGKITEADTEKVIIENTVKKKQPGKKKETQVHRVEILYTAIKTAKLLIR